MYFIVLWKEWSATIPASWLMLESEEFKWPPKEMKNPSIESKKKTLPNDDWEVIPFKKFLGPFGKYSHAH